MVALDQCQASTEGQAFNSSVQPKREG